MKKAIVILLIALCAISYASQDKVLEAFKIEQIGVKM